MSDLGLSGRRKALGSQCMQVLLQKRCQVIATPERMPDAFFGRYRLMAIDGTLFHTPDTKANAAAFGRSSNQYGPGAYPQVKCVLLAECGSHAVVGLEMDRYDVSEVHGAYRLLSQISRDTLVLVDAGLISGAFIEQVRMRRAHVLGALEAGAWEQPKTARRLADGSVLAWVAPAHSGHARYRQQCGMWVRIISYRVTDARLGEPGKVYRLVTTLLNPRVAPALTLINLYHPRLAQRDRGRANADLRSESRSELDSDPVRDERIRGMGSQKGRRGGTAREKGHEEPLGAAKLSEKKEAGGREARG